jgi:hypothetical protein
VHISQFVVHIGDHQEGIAHCTDDDPDVQELMRLASSTKIMVVVQLPQTGEAAAALGRLLFAKSKAERTSFSPARIAALSKRVDDLELSVRT